jgi:hypothetical protein
LETAYSESLTKTSTIGDKDSTIDLLQQKLKETSNTLLSNNSTIEDLRKSLAEA